MIRVDRVALGRGLWHLEQQVSVHARLLEVTSGDNARQ